MMSLLAKLNAKWDDYTEKGKENFLTDLLSEYKQVDYYKLFGVSQNISPSDVAKIGADFRKISLKLHPDKSRETRYEKQALELFLLAKEACETLSDHNKEQDYKLSLQRQSQEQEQENPMSQFDASWVNSVIAEAFKSGNVRVASSNVKVVYSNTKGPQNFFSSSSSSSSQASDKIYKGNITGMLSSGDGNVVIQGNVYGMVKSQGGRIIIQGDLHGMVKSVSGDIIVTGNVFGMIKNTSGDNVVCGMIAQSGKVKNMSGDNLIAGDISGSLENKSGRNRRISRETALAYAQINTSQNEESSSRSNFNF